MMTPDLSGDFQETIPQLFESQADRYGERVAMREKVLGIWQEITWNQYREQVRVAAAAMIALGVVRQDRLTILSKNRSEWLVCDLAGQYLGAVVAGIYPTNSAEEVDYIVVHSGAKLLFVEDEEQLDKILGTLDQREGLVRVIIYDLKGLRTFRHPKVMRYADFCALGRQGLEEDPEGIQRAGQGIAPDDPAIIIYTSGTTGPPKGAMLSHRNVIWTTRRLNESIPKYDTDEILSFLPLCHIAERQSTTYSQLVQGVVVNFAENLETVPRDLREVSPQAFFAVPRFWEKFYSSIVLTMKDSTGLEKRVYGWALEIGHRAAARRAEGRPLSWFLAGGLALADWAVFQNLRKLLGLNRGRIVFSGGAPIAPEILKFFHAVGVPLREVYGQTESTGPITIHHLNRQIIPGTVGQPISGVEVRIAEDGEILFRGPNVFQGYYGNPELTREYLQEDGWMHTGDVGKFDGEGNLIITDRKKDIIITSGGKNITPQYIENKLKFSPYINDAVVIGDRRHYLTALIMIDKENVTQFAQEQRVPFTTYKSLCHSSAVLELIGQEVRQVNDSLAQVENIRKFRLIDVELTSDDPELTATLKLKRRIVSEKYRGLIEEMYASSK